MMNITGLRVVPTLAIRSPRFSGSESDLEFSRRILEKLAGKGRLTVGNESIVVEKNEKGYMVVWSNQRTGEAETLDTNHDGKLLNITEEGSPYICMVFKQEDLNIRLRPFEYVAS